MALDEFKLFSWKSRETQQKEQEAYAKWAFPYGQRQRDRLEALVHSLYPKESLPSVLIPFLTCKELYERHLKQAGSVDGAVDMLLNNSKKYKHLLKKKDITTYAALVVADADVDDSCEYPSADEIRAAAQELDKRYNVK